MKSGGDQEFEARTVPHVHALFQTASQLTENRAAAQDLVHEVYNRARKSSGRSDLLTDWRLRLFKILVQLARRRSAKPEHQRPCSSLSYEVTAALARVPPGLREIILLIDCQEFSYEETAAILGLSRDAVAQSVVLAREQLMKEMAEISVMSQFGQ